MLSLFLREKGFSASNSIEVSAITENNISIFCFSSCAAEVRSFSLNAFTPVFVTVTLCLRHLNVGPKFVKDYLRRLQFFTI